ncbi:2'-5' RNA ligase family protein [Arthrobacter sp. MI7-26]|uniref:2'-5' RNA ligase family protein n=1 Tax=Arthrobacter sp. MI7-26 TaxID=2993653 RepID=UPI002248E99C|nr:2'-5' RNA ligase family protein [Arthrobacter sp. MI7-26]MCX2747352.1 2'-5' RNA ligase family protein [Arthrobacter sp. MI7-26]
MRNLILVAFVEAVTDGLVFPRSDWPLHITLLRFDVAPSDGDDVAARLSELVSAPAVGALGAELTVGPDAGFGHQGSIPVSLVDPHPILQGLHEELFDAMEIVGGRASTPRYVLDHYRPHISHHDGKRPKPGDAVVLDQIALVDMAPEGNHTIRRILKLWRLPAESS